MSHIATMNDGTTATPRLRPYLNLGTLAELPDFSAGPNGSPREIASALRSAGYEGVQSDAPDAYRELGLSTAILGRANTPEEIDAVARAWSASDYECGTLHVGWGYEDDDEIDTLVRAVVSASAEHGIPLYIETHRATITQDPWRTVRMVERNPDVRFNGDFSHWYTGMELPYGDLEDKMRRLEPVLERVRFMHARVGDSSNMQLTVRAPSMRLALDHVRELWIRSFVGFLRHAQPGDFLVLAPELLPASKNYARLVETPDGTWLEDSDRWEEALVLVEIARECWQRALERLRV
jgi:hypothetical protein